MKSIMCYIMSMIVSIFECIDVLLSTFIQRINDSDVYIDPSTETSIFGFTYHGQFIILGIAFAISIIGIVFDKIEDKKRWE